MWTHPFTIAGGKTAFLIFLCLFLGSCHSTSSTLKISFTKVPSADIGGTTKIDTIEGRAQGIRPGQRIVLYARSADVWWVQPYADHPFTKIQADSTWKSQTHLGSEYAALLVDPGYVPAATAEALPPPVNGVAAVAAIKGLGLGPASTPLPVAKTIRFSGYDWTVRTAPSSRGGSRNSFDPANSWTDQKGALHLRISKDSKGEWTCAEVKLTRSLGYGSYVFVVRDTSHLDPAAVLTFYTWDDLGSEQSRRELDVEISRWGYPQNENAHYVVQPYYIPTNVFRFVAPGGVLTHSFRWEPGEAVFSTVAGSRGPAEGRVVNKHVFTAGIPPAGGDLVHINLYVFGTGQMLLKNETEVVIEKFQYLP